MNGDRLGCVSPLSNRKVSAARPMIYKSKEGVVIKTKFGFVSPR